MCGVLDKSENPASDTLVGDDDQRVAEAVRSLALDRDVQVINLSFGGGVFDSKPTSLDKALQELDDRVAVVAAVGNGASDEPVYPAAFAEFRSPTVISVGALDERRLVPPGATPPRAAFSNYGNWVKAYASGVQVLGPFVYFDETGGDVYGLRPPQHFRGWARWSGTSFAAATVSGRIAQTAIERGITGAQAAQAVLGESRKIADHDVVWVRSAD
jgi:hypothetical protein